MVRLRPGGERGHFDHGWLDTFHSFSFGEYLDPDHMGHRSLRVMNEDRVAPGQGFGMHGHRDMEILTVVLSGTLEHKDSLGNGERLRPGEVQHMTAGTGIRHAEFNPSESELVHLYQVWLLPERTGLTPSYQQRAFSPEERRTGWQLVASPDGAAGSLAINQDARLWLASPESGTLDYEVAPGRHLWLQVLRGTASACGRDLVAGDGLALSDERTIAVTTESPAELMLFDLS